MKNLFNVLLSALAIIITSSCCNCTNSCPAESTDTVKVDSVNVDTTLVADTIAKDTLVQK